MGWKKRERKRKRCEVGKENAIVRGNVSPTLEAQAFRVRLHRSVR